MSRIRRGPCDRSLTPSSSLQTLAQRGDGPQTHFFLMPAHWHSTRTVYVYLVTIFDSSGDTVYHRSRFVQRKRISLILLRTTLYGSSSHLVPVRILTRHLTRKQFIIIYTVLTIFGFYWTTRKKREKLAVNRTGNKEACRRTRKNKELRGQAK